MVDNTDYCKYVNVFHGCSAIDLPKPEGIAATWYFIKAITGNTVPAAVLPFGKYSCCAYTTAYPGGYGDHLPNSSPWNLQTLPQGARLHGLSHFHQSGTGAIDYYYNYAVTTAFFGDVPNPDGYDIVNENGEPGYYSVLDGQGIHSEATVSENSVYHRFSFPEAGGKIAVDFTNDGLLKIHQNQYGRPQKGEITLVDKKTVRAHVVLEGLEHWFYYRVSGASVVSLHKNNLPISGDSVSFGCSEDTYGVLLEAQSQSVNGRLSVSFKSDVAALEELSTFDGDFDAVRNASYTKWNEYLSKIQIETEDGEEKRLFYSNMYHTLVKPCDRSGENPFGDGGFAVDFCTMWDIYKTQLPLIFTLYSDISEKIVNTMLLCCEQLGKMPHTLVLKENFLAPTSQAAMLAEHSIFDAFCRGVKADYTRAFELVLKDIYREDYNQLHSGELPSRLTHLLDAAEGCGAAAQLAEELGRDGDSQRLKNTAARMRECYDANTGLLKREHDYYEGNHWNYSFRLHRDMATRIELAGGKERYTQLLDRFFGYTFPDSEETRFEGFNNESDVETPYAYHYVGRHDRISEIIAAAGKYMFTTGRGGIPGNNDSGGLSSCFMWNSIGIFPVAGQDLMIIGTPRYNRVLLKLANGSEFTVIREGEGIYVKKATLNGEPLEELSFKASDLMAGGELRLEVSNSNS